MLESHSLEDTKKIAGDFLQKIESAYKQKREISIPINVVGLRGNLGSGKTAFAQSLGNILGVTETIQSPTYVIQKSYDITHPFFKKLFHLDLYRIENPDELKIFHLDEIFQDKSNLVLIEWPEKAGEDFFPLEMIYIDFEFVDETTRRISYTI